MGTLIAVIATIIYLSLVLWFLWSADQDTQSWDNAWDRLTHPYSLRTQVLLLVILLVWMPVLVLWDVS